MQAVPREAPPLAVLNNKGILLSAVKEVLSSKAEAVYLLTQIVPVQAQSADSAAYGAGDI